MIQFDPHKARANLQKHGIDFADVEPVLYDPRAYTTCVEWPTSHGMELRCITTGRDALGRVITVVWTQRGADHRLISARPSRNNEREHYERA